MQIGKNKIDSSLSSTAWRRGLGRGGSNCKRCSVISVYFASSPQPSPPRCGGEGACTIAHMQIGKNKIDSPLSSTTWRRGLGRGGSNCKRCSVISVYFASSPHPSPPRCGGEGACTIAHMQIGKNKIDSPLSSTAWRRGLGRGGSNCKRCSVISVYFASSPQPSPPRCGGEGVLHIAIPSLQERDGGKACGLGAQYARPH